MLEHILVAVDGSEDGKRAARFARDLARKVGARLTLLHAIDPPDLTTSPYTSSGTLHTTALHQGERLLDVTAKALEIEGAERAVEAGHAAEVICDEAERRNVDLIVVGSRGLGTAKRWLLGSVSDRVVHHSKRPVTVVR